MHDNPLNQGPPPQAPGAPPPNVYGPPGAQPQQPQQPNAYAAPAAFDYQPVETYESDEGGNYALGFIVGFLFSFLGLIAVQIFGKYNTKRGSVHGFLGAVALGAIRLVILFSA